MSAYGTKLAEGFSNKVMEHMYDKNLLDEIVNRDYEGEINGVGSRLNILNFGKISEKDYENSAMSYDALTEDNHLLEITKKKSFYWAEKTLAKWLSYVKDPHPKIVKQVASERRKNMDTFLFSLWGDVGAGNWIGTDYVTGTVTIDASGNVTGDSTVFTSAMVGKPFKATGHSAWYRVKTFTSTTAIVIEDDLDDVDSQYTGGAIDAGSSYTIQANTAVTITASNLLEYIGKLKLALDEAEANGHSSVPDEDRWLVLPPKIVDLIPRATGVALHVPAVYEELIKKGMVTELQGFKVFKSNRLAGDNTNGYKVLAGHPNWVTFAEKVLQVRMEEDLPGDFGTAYKDLFVYGAKIVDLFRHQASLGLWKV